MRTFDSHFAINASERAKMSGIHRTTSPDRPQGRRFLRNRGTSEDSSSGVGTVSSHRRKDEKTATEIRMETVKMEDNMEEWTHPETKHTYNNPIMSYYGLKRVVALVCVCCLPGSHQPVMTHPLNYRESLLSTLMGETQGTLLRGRGPSQGTAKDPASHPQNKRS